MTAPIYDTLHQFPGMTAAVETFENEFLLEGYPYNTRSSAVVAAASVDAGNTSNTGLLRKGLLMSYNRNAKTWGPWTYYTPNDATNNYLQSVDGVLGISIDMGDNTTDRMVPIVTHGKVIAERLIVPGTSAAGGSYGLAGSNLKYAVGRALSPHIVLDSLDYHTSGAIVYVADDDTALDMLDYPNGTTFVYTGGNVVAQALPTPVPGLEITICCHGDSNAVFTSPVDNSIYMGNATGNTLTMSDEGDMVKLLGFQSDATPTYGYMVLANTSVTDVGTALSQV